MSKLNWPLFFVNFDGYWGISPPHHSAIFAVKQKHTAQIHTSSAHAAENWDQKWKNVLWSSHKREKPNLPRKGCTRGAKSVHFSTGQNISPHFYHTKLKYTSWQIAFINAFFKKTRILLQIPLICFFKGFSGSSHLWETIDRWRLIHWNGILDWNESTYINVPCLSLNSSRQGQRVNVWNVEQMNSELTGECVLAVMEAMAVLHSLIWRLKSCLSSRPRWLKTWSNRTTPSSCFWKMERTNSKLCNRYLINAFIIL